ncbi:CpsD/CapB family tyrosine-protein kinase [Novosphingobium sp. Gsoil 351]|uniref:CpsD/CapB family tyrosine-protein kinase n=1 Tax=Novosphingobium sp. Gsoil 351 TaxID=2675225 RepID=UPI0018A87C97|nr:CpsD/CapB family tyrosine-protein kinase [Novosphingobium sp. Gsoil 351]
MTRRRDNAIATPMRIPAIEELNSVRVDGQALAVGGIVGFASRDLRSRPFALLRSQIQRRLGRKHARLIGVTSAAPGEGKSFLSLNLAAALARVSEAPVYLIDLDLRRGTLASALGLSPTSGVGAILTGDEQEIANVGWRIEDANLAVFPTLPIEEGSAELLAGESFARFAAGLRALPDESIVLCDLPPVFAGDDAMITLEHLDGYLLVVDSGKTTVKQVAHAIQLLEPTPCLGTILNRYQGGVADHYSYNYGYDVDNKT